jgi:tRNA A-37 threonylcarbamoyl transferase component Bud32
MPNPPAPSRPFEAIAADHGIALPQALDISLLNRLASKKALQAIAELGPHVTDPTIRAVLFAEMVVGAGAIEIRRLLSESANVLLDLQNEERAVWADTLLPRLINRAKSLGDESMFVAAVDAVGSDDPVESLAKWATTVFLADAVEKLPPSSTVAQATPSPDSRSDRLLLRWAGLAPDDVEAIRTEASALLKELGGLAAETPSIFEWSEQSAPRAARFLELVSRVPLSGAARREGGSRLDDCVAKLSKHMTTELAFDLLDGCASIDEAEQAAGRVAHDATLAALPEWLWIYDQPESHVPSSAFERAKALLSSGTDTRVATILRVLHEQKWDEVSIVRELSEPRSADADVLADIAASLTNLIEAQRQLAAVPVWASVWVERARREAVPRERILDLLDRQRGLDIRAGLAEEVGRHLAGLGSHDERADFVGRLAQRVQTLRGLGLLPSVTFDQLLASVASLAAAPASPMAPSMEIQDQRFNSPLSRADLRFVGIDGTPHGFVLLPLLLQARHPLEGQFQVVVTARSSHGDQWPSEWERASPQRLNLSQQDWRPNDRGHYEHELILRLPVRPPAGLGVLRLGISMTAGEHHAVADLHWEEHRISPWEQLVFDWPERTDREFVEQHPLGPQVSADELRGHLLAGRSVGVVAPRRFGKSILARYLKEQMRERGYIVAYADCRLHARDERVMDHEALWNAVSDSLHEACAAGFHADGSGALPAKSSVQQVRKAAKASGATGVVLFLDEAQCLFPLRDGGVFAARLKNALEESWSEGDGGPRIQLALFGLPSMRERAGPNLTNALEHGEGQYRLDESQLNRLIRSVTANRLQTTTDARYHLAKVTQNIWVLRVLLGRLRGLLNGEQRSFATLQDVRKLENTVLGELRLGEGESLRSYIRDPLSEADDDSWQPGGAYVAALAMARALEVGHGEPDLEAEARKLLDRWAADLAPLEGNHLVVPAGRVRKFLDVLRERQVLDDNLHFKQPLLQAWLVSETQNGFPKRGDARAALLQGAISRIRVPDGAERVHEGAEAQVWRHTTGSDVWTYRVAQLRSVADEERFLESIGVLERIRSIRQPGWESMFELRDVGFAEGEGSRSVVQVYRWIEGVAMEQRRGEIARPLLMAIGIELAKTVSLLHDQGVLHRDIAPRNVVIRDRRQTPVLIDFGLARVLGRETLTAFSEDDDCAAPEVRRKPPQWGPAADVYALARTLVVCARAGERRDVEKVMSPFLNETPSARGTATAMKEVLESEAITLRVQATKAKAEQRFLGLVSPAGSVPGAVTQTIEQFALEFGMIGLGGVSELQRMRVVCDLLNQLHEASGLLSLGKLSHNMRTSGSTDVALLDVLACVSKIRNSRNHGHLKDVRWPEEPWPKLTAAARWLEGTVGVGGLVAAIECARDEFSSGEARVAT